MEENILSNTLFFDLTSVFLDAPVPAGYPLLEGLGIVVSGDGVSNPFPGLLDCVLLNESALELLLGLQKVYEDKAFSDGHIRKLIRRVKAGQDTSWKTHLQSKKLRTS